MLKHLPRSTKVAFVDGFVSAAILAYYAHTYRVSYLAKSYMDRNAKKENEMWDKGWRNGCESTRLDLKPYIDMEYYHAVYGNYDKKD